MIRKAVATLEDDLAADIEQALAEAAPHITQAQLADLAQVVKAAAAPEDAEAAAKKNHANQSLSISKTFDGMYRVDGWLDTKPAPRSPPPSKRCYANAIPTFPRSRTRSVNAAPKRCCKWPVTR